MGSSLRRRIPASAGIPKERTFESTFTVTLRQARRKPKAAISRPTKVAHSVTASNNDSPKSTDATGKGDTPLQSSFPMGDITEREADEPRINPMAIQPQPRPRGQVGKPTAKAARTPLTAEQKRERNRKRVADHRQRQKDNGLCVGCPNKPIEGQTRCTECAEKHRARIRTYAETHRRAQGAKPTKHISEAELLELIQKEVDTRESQVSDPSTEEAQPDTKSLSRVQRISLGICSDCDYPSEEGHARCTLCLLRLRLDARRRRRRPRPSLRQHPKRTRTGLADTTHRNRDGEPRR